jgi:phosphotriesterase-related protein
MGRFVRTALGDITSEEIRGKLLAHEHVNFDTSKIKRDSDACLIEPETIIEELKAFSEAGGEVLVDLSTSNTGRDPKILEDISQKSGVGIVCPTGFYFGLYLPLRAISGSVSFMAEEFVRDINEGIDGSDVKAGVIGEIGWGQQTLPAERRVFESAVLAQGTTGAAIITHTYYGFNAVEQLDFLEKKGANIEKVGIGHMDLYPDPEIHLEVARRGAYVCIDNIGRTDYRPDSERVQMIRFLFEKGLGNRVIISSDISRKSHLHKYGGHGYDHVLKTFASMLFDDGFSEDEINLLLHENPLRLISIPGE